MIVDGAWDKLLFRKQGLSIRLESSSNAVMHVLYRNPRVLLSRNRGRTC